MQRTLHLLLLLVSLQSQAQTKSLTIHVEPYKQLTYGVFFKSLVIKSDVEGPQYIQGFNYVWGRAYTLKVKSHKLQNPPQDGSNTEYTLISVLEDKPAAPDLEFELSLHHNVYLGGEVASPFEATNDSTFRYFDEIELEVPATLRPEFDKVLAGTDRKGRFVFVHEQRIRLVGFSK